MKYLDDLDLKGKRVFLRADFNVPLDKAGNITDDNRIRGVLPTLRHILDNGGAIVLASHLGRPKGKPVPEYSLKPVAARLSELLKIDVPLAPDCIGEKTTEMAAALQPGQVLLLENLRYHKAETDNDPEFAQKLAALAEVYVNDAFAVCHRENASVEAITRFFKEKAAGFLLKNELQYFDKAMKDPKRPLVAIVGGAKISSKMGALRNLMANVDKIIIGGAMANTFLKALYGQVGKSLVEDEQLGATEEVVAEAKKRNIKLYLPVDCVVAGELDASAEAGVSTAQEIPEDLMALDIGPATSKLYEEALQNAGTVIWNGPMGAFETAPFSKGTYDLVSVVAQSPALTIIGGGDTDMAVHKAGAQDKMSYISTGGGAFLELLEGKTLPAVAALSA